MTFLAAIREDKTLGGFYPLDMLELYKDLPKESIKIDSELHQILIAGKFKLNSYYIDKDEVYTVEDIVMFDEVPMQVSELPKSAIEMELEETREMLINTMDAMAQMYEILLANNLM
jgi:hypothetical protein